MRPKSSRSSSQLLRSLRSLRVLVAHPQDRDGEELVRHIQRIGCQVQANWPPPAVLPPTMDVVFLAVRPDVSLDHLEWIDGDDDPVVVAIIDYENPTIVETVLDIGAMAVIGAPVRPFGVLTNLVVALKAHRESREQRQRITKLDGKLNGIRRMTKAKTILMESRGVSEEEAYKTIRDQAMARRVTTEDIANAIINAEGLLNFE